ncbi:MAG TPA: DUF167 domain-containing protein [bacterium]|nr:DUF167 domain-containing protein [bacterium]
MVTVPLRVTPRARADRITGWRDGRLHVRTTAPPLEGRANDAVRRLLARTLGVSASRIALTQGRHSRDKVAAVSGLSADEVSRRLGGDPAAPGGAP